MAQITSLQGSSALFAIVPTGLLIATSVIWLLGARGTVAKAQPSQRESDRAAAHISPATKPSGQRPVAGDAHTVAASDDTVDYDIDEWKRRRQAARFGCDAIVLLLIAVGAWMVFNKDYNIDLLRGLDSYFPREFALLRNIFSGLAGKA